MKNAQGLHRSPEFLKAHPEQAPKLHHMRVHMPNEDGEVKVTHHAGPAMAAMATHHLKGEELAEHVLEHTGQAYGSEGGGEHYADEGEEVEK